MQYKDTNRFIFWIKSADAWKISYRFTASGRVLDWNSAVLCARDLKEYLQLPGTGIVKLSSAFGRFFRAVNSAVRNVDTASCTFEIPFCNVRYYCSIASEIPGALVSELLTEATGSDKPGP